MSHASFQEWMANIEQLSSMQYQQAEAAFFGGSEEMEAASLAVIEASVGDDRKCCLSALWRGPRAISRGKSRGLRRYQCKTCIRTFNAATGTPLSGIHKKKGSGLHTGPVFPRGLRSVIQPNAVTCLFLPHSTGGIAF